MNFSPYAFCENNPVLSVDPSGLRQFQYAPPTTYISPGNGWEESTMGGGGAKNFDQLLASAATWGAAQAQAAVDAYNNQPYITSNGDGSSITYTGLYAQNYYKENISFMNGIIRNFGGMHAVFEVSGVEASSLQAIQVYYGSQKYNKGTDAPGDPYIDNGEVYNGFVDGGVNSPYAAENGGPVIPGKPYYISPTDDGNGSVLWDPKTNSGGITISDMATATNSISTTRFEVYLVAVNYQNSGQDKILGGYTWGYNNSGRGSISGNSINFYTQCAVSPIAQQIISHDYPNYKLYGQ